jgi:glycine cleavage system H lipoate-binding protein
MGIDPGIKAFGISRQYTERRLFMKSQTKRKTRPRIKGFQVVENECIWMKAGVINFRLCDSAYDCNHCAFDKGMRRAMGIDGKEETEKVAPDWVRHLKEKYRGAELPCRHSLTGRVEAPKICTLNYECYHCAFDQMLDDIDVNQPANRPQLVLAAGYRMAQDYYYHLGHSWARFEHGGRVRVGLDDFAVSLFGAFGSLALPPLGATVVQNEVGWTFRRDVREAAVLTPVSGKVLAVNQKAVDHPEISHEDPYHQGWLFMVEPDFPARNLKRLYFGEQSLKWMEMESQQLLALMGPEYERLAATGAEPVRDVVGTVPQLEWDNLARRFLRTRTG